MRMVDDLFNTLIEAVPEPMLHLDAAGLIVASNAAARGVLGDWIRGRSYATVLRQPSILGRIESVQADGTAGEARFELADNAGSTQFRVRITALGAPGDGSAGRPAGAARYPLLLHFTDITHLREAEEMRRDFVANVSHELRTPLTAVLGFIETLRGAAKDDPAARDRFLSIMEDEARRMNRLVSDLLSLSRVESEERMRPSDLVDIGAVLKGTVAAMRPTAELVGQRDPVFLPDRGRRGGDGGARPDPWRPRSADAGVPEPHRERAEIRRAEPSGRAELCARMAAAASRAR
jgi:two-component system phosphate regulon sensor histidine kinase PhoR